MMTRLMTDFVGKLTLGENRILNPELGIKHNCSPYHGCPPYMAGSYIPRILQVECTLDNQAMENQELRRSSWL